jgi:hypothetical protein
MSLISCGTVALYGPFFFTPYGLPKKKRKEKMTIKDYGSAARVLGTCKNG